ncbi:MAG: TlpA disulfide reductase family protein [Eubacteriales bacterium]|nr:TlpA disulfide reductase family protein [Eubacteriales bacterium]
MKKTNRLFSLLCAALLLLTPAFSVAETEPEKTAFEIITENTTLDLTPYAGKAIFMNFFTEWCPYCMQELPDIKKIYEAYSENDLQIILVHVWDGEDASNTESIRKKYGLEEMTFFEDKDQLLSSMAGIQGYPLSLFFDKEGNIATGANGMLDYDSMAQAVESVDVSKKSTDGAVAK